MRFPLTGKDEAAGLADRLREMVAVSVSHARASDVMCKFSAGVDEFVDRDTLAALMARADAALYAAKANGRNCVVIASSSQGDGFEPIGETEKHVGAYLAKG